MFLKSSALFIPFFMFSSLSFFLPLSLPFLSSFSVFSLLYTHIFILTVYFTVAYVAVV